jgi:hypothetical protein
LIKGACYEQKNSANVAIRPAFSTMVKPKTTSRDLNALYAIRRLSGQTKRTKDTTKNSGLNSGYMTAIQSTIYLTYPDIAAQK